MAATKRERRFVIKHILCQIYREYMYKLRRALNLTATKPLMKQREIDIVGEILKGLQPNRCLEWGTGYSTLSFPGLLGKNAKWISVEHEKEWATKIAKINQSSIVEVYNIAPNHFPWTDKYRDGSYSDLKNYVDFPTKFENFDFILVDGRARKDCLIKAYELLEEDGVVILHDANREYYHEVLKLYKYQVFFKNYRKGSHGLWVGSKGRNIPDFLDVDKHIKIWQFYSLLGKFFAYVRGANTDTS